MQKEKFTQDQIDAAWNGAPPAAGYPPNLVRADRISGRFEKTISRADFGRKCRGGWTIDDRGRARVYRYEFIEEKAARDRKEDAQRLAAEAGMPNAVALFERILMLEEKVQSQELLIDSLVPA